MEGDCARNQDTAQKNPRPPASPAVRVLRPPQGGGAAFLEVRVLVGARVPRAKAYAIQRETARLRSPLMKRPYVRAILW